MPHATCHMQAPADVSVSWLWAHMGNCSPTSTCAHAGHETSLLFNSRRVWVCEFTTKNIPISQPQPKPRASSQLVLPWRILSNCRAKLDSVSRNLVEFIHGDSAVRATVTNVPSFYWLADLLRICYTIHLQVHTTTQTAKSIGSTDLGCMCAGCTCVYVCLCVCV